MIYRGDCRDILPTLDAGSVHCVVTSPPYWGLRDYGVAGQLGLEPTPEEYVAALVTVFREVKRVLRDDGTVWLNLGDSYANNFGTCNAGASAIVGATLSGNQTARNRVPPGLKPKDLVGIPWRVAFALQADGWYLRSDIIWSKPNPMPESVTDRPTKSHEYVFLLSKRARYYFDAEAVREASTDRASGNTRINGYAEADPVKGRTPANLHKIPARPQRNIRSVWNIATQPYAEAHFATFPEALAARCILAGCPEGGTVLDPFAGSGTVGRVAERHNRRWVLIELNPEYVKLAQDRTVDRSLGLTGS